MVVQWHAIQPQKLFRVLSVSACCVYCQQGRKKRKPSPNVGLLHICLYISHFHKRVKCDRAFHWDTWQNVKRCVPFPNLSLPNSNLETPFYLTVLKGFWAVMVVFEYSPFCLSGTASATIWHHPSALAIAAFSEGRTTPSESYCYPDSIVHTSTSQRQRHTLLHLYTQSCSTLN